MTVKAKNNRVGPGAYNYQNASTLNLLSQNKKTPTTKFTKSSKKK